jgi:hypothetical protein
VSAGCTPSFVLAVGTDPADVDRWPPKRFTSERGLAAGLTGLGEERPCRGMFTSTVWPSLQFGNGLPSVTAGVPGFRSLRIRVLLTRQWPPKVISRLTLGRLCH